MKEPIYLRPITQDDTPAVLAWRNSEIVRQHFLYRDPITAQAHTAWLNEQVATGAVYQFILVERASGQAFGSTYIQHIDAVHRHAEYGVFIGEPAFLGRGLGTAAAKLTIRFAFEELGLHKLYLRVLATNARAIACYKKAGFQTEGILRDEALLDGRYRDIIRMAIINEESL